MASGNTGLTLYRWAILILYMRRGGGGVLRFGGK